MMLIIIASLRRLLFVSGVTSQLTCSILVRLARCVRSFLCAFVLLGVWAGVGVHQPLLA